MDVIDYKADPQSGAMEWIMFRQDGDKIAVIDDASYRIFNSKDGTIGELESEAAHDLG